ncbi:MAG: mobile mystery protein B [Bacilli bacterium]|nr:mobile mystery protein B [Bacilli bacterium]
MGLGFDYILDGQSPLDYEERSGLLIKTVSTHQELNEFEQQNIELAIEWLMKQNILSERLLTEIFVKELHYQMFGNVWGWAGQFRQSNKNIGVDKRLIRIELKKLFDDCRYWIDNKVFCDEEMAVRFKHRLVAIHPFANGNGRHSRLMADVIMDKIFKKPVFIWGGSNLVFASVERSEYIKSVREADAGNFGPLLKFAQNDDYSRNEG